MHAELVSKQTILVLYRTLIRSQSRLTMTDKKRYVNRIRQEFRTPTTSAQLGTRVAEARRFLQGPPELGGLL